MILKRLESVIQQVFQSSGLRNGCLIDGSFENVVFTSDICRPVTVTLPGAISLDV